MSEPGNLRYLSQETLEALAITTEDVVQSIEHLIYGCAQSRVWSAPKSVVLPPDGRYLMATLAAADDPPFMAVKSLILNPRNSERGLKQINALVTLLDSDTGLPMAIIDGNWITAVRTAGLSAVAAKRMARPDSTIAAFIGCGVQAQSHMEAFADLFPLKQIRAFGRGRSNIEALCTAAQERGLSAIASSTARDAVDGADLVITSVTYSSELEPFLNADWLKPGAFATITDLAAPWLDDSMPAFNRIIIDDHEQESSMPNPLVRPDLIGGDLSGLVTGGVTGRENDEERTAFIFRGLALGDLAVAALAYKKARDSSQGWAIRS